MIRSFFLLQDNEDEIAELMLASTTIKKDTASRKKAKQARELENIKRLREAENETAQEERDTSRFQSVTHDRRFLNQFR